MKIFQIRIAQPQKACLGKVFEETTEDAIAVDRGRGKEVDVRAELKATFLVVLEYYRVFQKTVRNLT